MDRPKRVRRAPVPLYVPDENQVMTDDFDDEEDDGESLGEDSGSDGSDVSYSGSEENEYQYDDFLVPDQASVSQAGSDDEDEESSFSGSDDSDDSDDSDNNDDSDSDEEMQPPEAEE